MFNLLRLISFLILLLANTPNQALAFGNDNEWVSGFGMGVCESLIKKGPGNDIYVACDCGSGLGSTVNFTLEGNAPTGNSILLTFDGEDPEEFWISDGKITSDCHACSANFDVVLERFKKHKSVHVRFENGLSARFSLKGANAAIGECISDFAR
jgi:hypothetical protein